MSAIIDVVCPKCGKRVATPRQEYDYPEAVELLTTCPDCWDGDFDDGDYRDANGNEVNYDPALIRRRSHPERG